MNYKIDAGVPIPPSKGSYEKNGPKYPWNKMSEGDSFFVETDDPKRTVNTMTTSGHAWCKRNAPEMRVSTRRVDGGVRVWLVRKES